MKGEEEKEEKTFANKMQRSGVLTSKNKPKKHQKNKIYGFFPRISLSASNVVVVQVNLEVVEFFFPFFNVTTWRCFRVQDWGESRQSVPGSVV